MVSNGNLHTELDDQPKYFEHGTSRPGANPEDELENRIVNLEKLANSVHAALGQQSFAGKPRALDLASDLRLKIKATVNMFQVAKLLREPARASLLSKVSNTVDELEEVVASKLGVEMS